MKATALHPKLVVHDGLHIVKNEFHALLREGKITEFNAKRKKGETLDLSNCNLRGIDLRGIDASNIDFTGSYLRQADMRGLDLRMCNFEGASLNQTVISGTYFPDNVTAEELKLSHRLGTRIRVTK